MKQVSWFVLSAALAAPTATALADDEVVATASEPAAEAEGGVEVHVHGVVQGWWLVGRAPAPASAIAREAEAPAETEVLLRHAWIGAGVERGPWVVDGTFDLAPVIAVGPARVDGGEPLEPIEFINDLVVRHRGDHVTISVGQEGQPIGLDGPRPHGEQWFADRSELGYALGQTADIGAWADVTYGPMTARAGVLGGGGPNHLPGGDPRVIARMAAGERLVVGATTLVGVAGRRDWLAGVDGSYARGPVKVGVEAYAGALPDEDGEVGPTAAAAVGEAAVTLGAWMPAARVEWFDGDVALGGNAVVRGTACVSYAFDGRALDRMQLQVSAAHHQGDAMATAPDAGHRVLLAGQVGF